MAISLKRLLSDQDHLYLEMFISLSKFVSKVTSKDLGVRGKQEKFIYQNIQDF